MNIRNIKVKVVKDFFVQDIDGNDVWFRKHEICDFQTFGPAAGWPMIKSNMDNEYYDVTCHKKDEDSKEWYSEDNEVYLVEV